MPYLAPGSDGTPPPSPADAGPATPKPSRSEFAAAASAAAEVARANKENKNSSDASPAETHDVSRPPPKAALLLLSADEPARVTSTVAIDQANTVTVPDVTITPPATDKTDKAKQVSRASSTTGRQLRLRLLSFVRKIKAWMLNRDARDPESDDNDDNRKIATTNSNTKE